MPDLNLPEMTKDYYGAGGDLRLSEADDDSQLRLIPLALLRALVADAQQQVDGVRAHAALFGLRGTHNAEARSNRAEDEWRRKHSGLARLLRLAAGEY